MLLSLSLLPAYAENASSGEKIKAIEYNNSTFSVGDVKHSLLTIAEFQTLHGSCWIQLNQGADNSSIDISGSDLASIKGNNTLISATGRVLRAQGGESASLGQTQEDEIKAHSHEANFRGNTSGDHYHRTEPIAFSGVGSSYDFGSDKFYSTQETGGSETRMKNLTVNIFVKINHSCL